MRIRAPAPAARAGVVRVGPRRCASRRVLEPPRACSTRPSSMPAPPFDRDTARALAGPSPPSACSTRPSMRRAGVSMHVRRACLLRPLTATQHVPSRLEADGRQRPAASRQAAGTQERQRMEHLNGHEYVNSPLSTDVLDTPFDPLSTDVKARRRTRAPHRHDRPHSHPTGRPMRCKKKAD